MRRADHVARGSSWMLGLHAVVGALAVPSLACKSGCGGEVCCAWTATQFSALGLLSAAAGSCSEVIVCSVSASAPLVFFDSDVVVDSHDGSCAICQTS